MAALAGTTLAWPGSALDRLWALNPSAYRQMEPAGEIIGPLFLFLSAVLLAAAIGWFKRKRWGWSLAVGIIVTQVAGDFVNLLRGDFLRGGTGVVIASALLFFSLRPNVRAEFH